MSGAVVRPATKAENVPMKGGKRAMQHENFIIFDGALGTELIKLGMKPGEIPELYNFTHPELIGKIHKSYIDAGADVITANTFGANRKKLEGKADVRETVIKAVKIARKAGAKRVALDIGPTGAMLKPLGAMSFGEAYDIFAEVVKAGAEAGTDIALVETMSDMLEAKAALLAVKENSDLPVYVTMTFGKDGRTFLGTTPEVAAITLSSLGADAVGINCSLGPADIMSLADTVLKYSTVPVIVQPNAGLPRNENGVTIYDVTPEDFARYVTEMAKKGVLIVGGCCGTTPLHIKLLKEKLKSIKPNIREIESRTAFTSGQSAFICDGNIGIIGERINPTGKQKIKESLRSGDYDYIINEAISQAEAGADILDVNAGLPEIDEPSTLEKLITDIQAVSALPLQIDSSDPVAIERAVRVYNGKPIINSVNGTKESLNRILPIAKKYGAAVVGLTLDENGIPELACDRLKIAEKIVSRAENIGIPKEDVLIDCLVMTVSTNQSSAKETLKAVSLVTEKLGVKTVLGVSNVSFGLPQREVINSAFLGLALGAGLTLPILNPMSKRYMDTVSAHKVISGEDKGSVRYISNYSSAPAVYKDTGNKEISESIETIVLSGRKPLIADAVKRELNTLSVMDVINKRLIPAINIAGDKFEKGEFFLPQLMLSAETVKIGFDTLKNLAPKGEIQKKGKILLATVKGDIHDIGKNIVKMLLINYGYDVIDLGKDVDPETVAEEAVRQNIKLVGLSALMTTTVKSIEETVKALKNAGSDAKVMVGGAVLNEEYAKLTGADYYAKDASASARIAGEVLK